MIIPIAIISFFFVSASAQVYNWGSIPEGTSDYSEFKHFGFKFGRVDQFENVRVYSKLSDDGTPWIGQVHIEEFDGSSWSETQLIQEDTDVTMFGKSVYVLSNGAGQDPHIAIESANKDSGKFYFYEKQGGTWTKTFTYNNTHGGTFAHVSTSVNDNEHFAVTVYPSHVVTFSKGLTSWNDPIIKSVTTGMSVPSRLAMSASGLTVVVCHINTKCKFNTRPDISSDFTSFELVAPGDQSSFADVIAISDSHFVSASGTSNKAVFYEESGGSWVSTGKEFSNSDTKFSDNPSKGAAITQDKIVIIGNQGRIYILNKDADFTPYNLITESIPHSNPEIKIADNDKLIITSGFGGTSSPSWEVFNHALSTASPTASPTTPTPPPTFGCDTSSECLGTDEICNGVGCVQQACVDHVDCKVAMLPTRLPYCDGEFCQDVAEKSCDSDTACEISADVVHSKLNALFTITRDIKVSNPSKRQQIALGLANKAKEGDTENIVHVLSKGRERVTVYNDLFLTVNNDTMTLEGICKARCGDKSHSCKCTITGGSGRRMMMRSKRSLQALQQPVSVTITWEIDYDTYVALESTGETFDDPEFIQAIATELGVDVGTITVLTSDGDIELTVNLVDEDVATGDITELVTQMQDIDASLDNTTSILIDSLNLDPLDVEKSEVDLCGDRDCNGRGTCDLTSGICACVGDWWGVNCEIACECSKGGTCKDAYCHCEFPHYDQRCESVAKLGAEI